MLKMNFDTYAATYENAADFSSILTQMRSLLGDSPVINHPLEASHDLRFGPASPLIALFPLPDATLDILTEPTRRNISPGNAILDQMRDINKSGQDKDTCWALKKTLFDTYTAAQNSDTPAP